MVSSDAGPSVIGSLVVVALAWAGIGAWGCALDAPAPTGGTAGNSSADCLESAPAPPQESAVGGAVVRVRVLAVQVNGGTVSGIVAPQPPASAGLRVTVGEGNDATITCADAGSPRTGTDAR